MDKMIFGDYVAIQYTGTHNNNKRYLVKCNVCGHEKECSISNLMKQDNSHSKFNCKRDYYKEYIGKVFGDFTCIGVKHLNDSSWNLVLRCNICGKEIVKHLDKAMDIKHSASRCRDRYYQNMVGNVYGDMRILAISDCASNQRYFECECIKCGIKSKRSITAVKKNLAHGRECYKQIADSPLKKAVEQRWVNMYNRCNNPRNTSYSYYGARGIECKYEHPVDLYLDFADKLEEHAKIYGLRNSTFDRIDVNGNYEKNNLRIATQCVQSTNTTRRRIFILRKGDDSIISDSAMHCGRILGLNGRSIGNVVRGKSKSSGGWILDRVLSPDEDPYKVIDKEGVTTNLLTTL